MKKVITLEGMTKEIFMEERHKLIKEWWTSPPMYTTEDKDICYMVDDRVYVTIEQFLRKKRNWDFAIVEDNGWVLVWYSKFIFLK